MLGRGVSRLLTKNHVYFSKKFMLGQRVISGRVKPNQVQFAAAPMLALRQRGQAISRL